MFNIVLVAPEIPPNTGNVIRLAANTGCRLHLIEPLGFAMTDPLLRRAGLDYHEYVDVRRHASWPAFLAAGAADPASAAVRVHDRGRARSPRRASAPATGSSSAPRRRACPPRCAPPSTTTQPLRLPMRAGQRSLNLSNAVAVAVFEAWRQNGYAGSARERRRRA